MVQTKSVQRTIYLTPEMQERLEQLLCKRGREVSQNDLIREALRYYLDNQEDILGSSRPFQKSLQEHVDKLEMRLASTTVQTTLIPCFTPMSRSGSWQTATSARKHGWGHAETGGASNENIRRRG
jgi:Arc/MetJ-type ribon-helix-helix transcriptional regulator